jgi:hypothetical protein
MVGMWAGYFLIGVSVPSLIITHNYYNLFAIPVVALSLAPLSQLLFSRIVQQGKVWQILFIFIAVADILFSAWNARTKLVSRDYRSEILGWIKIGKEMPQESRIIGLTHDYNMRMLYYGWTYVQSWPLKADADMGVLAGGNENMSDPYWNDYFNMRAKHADYFLVTSMDELDLQPLLKENPSRFSYINGDRYILYDLRKPK